MANSSKESLYYEQIGEQFQNWSSVYDSQQRILLIDQFLPVDSKSRTCLEVGCGFGAISTFLKDKVEALTVSDISEKLARETGEKLGLESMSLDACKVHEAGTSYDLIVSSECIEHSPDPLAAISSMTASLNPGGHLIVTTPNKLWYPVLWLSIKLNLRKFEGIENWLFPSQAKQVLEEAGFEEIKLSGCHLFPWQMPLAKKMLPAIDKLGSYLYPLMINFCISGRKKS